VSFEVVVTRVTYLCVFVRSASTSDASGGVSSEFRRLVSVELVAAFYPSPRAFVLFERSRQNRPDETPDREASDGGEDVHDCFVE
jgi:hypothetical protein